VVLVLLRYHWPALGRNTPTKSCVSPTCQWPTTAASPGAPKLPMRIVLSPGLVPLKVVLVLLRYHWPVLGRKTPTKSCVSPACQRPTTGTSPGAPKLPMRIVLSPGLVPLKVVLVLLRYHWPVLGRKTPTSCCPFPSQSPWTAISPDAPKLPMR